MSESEKEGILSTRKRQGNPWHQPPHFVESDAIYAYGGLLQTQINHWSQPEAFCEAELLETWHELSHEVHAWCILPNHYHILVNTKEIAELLHALGR